MIATPLQLGCDVARNYHDDPQILVQDLFAAALIASEPVVYGVTNPIATVQMIHSAIVAVGFNLAFPNIASDVELAIRLIAGGHPNHAAARLNAASFTLQLAIDVYRSGHTLNTTMLPIPPEVQQQRDKLLEHASWPIEHRLELKLDHDARRVRRLNYTDVAVIQNDEQWKLLNHLLRADGTISRKDAARLFPDKNERDNTAKRLRKQLKKIGLTISEWHLSDFDRS